jgi:hypothetical protein
MQTKHCKKCNLTLPISSFCYFSASKDGRFRFCKPCQNLYKRNLRLIKKGKPLPLLDPFKYLSPNQAIEIADNHVQKLLAGQPSELSFLFQEASIKAQLTHGDL